MLDLSHNDFGDVGVVALAGATGEGTLDQLEALTLDSCRVGSVGLAALAAAAAGAPGEGLWDEASGQAMGSLHSLSLAGNRIGSPGLQALVA